MIRAPYGPLRFSDASTPDVDAWLWCCNEGYTRYLGRDITITPEQLDLLYESAQGWRPPVRMEHDGTNDEIGEIVRTRILTQAEAQALGIEQRRGRSLYAGVRWLGEGAERDARGLVRYTSPGIDIDKEDDEGRRWPMFLMELSAVQIPHNKRSQPHREELRGITMSDQEDTMDEEIEDVGTDVACADAGMQTLTDEVMRLAARMEELIALVAESRDDSRKVEAEAKGDGVDMADRVATLERELAMRDARDAVRELGATRVVDKPERLVALRMRDVEAYGLVAESLPVRPEPTERVAIGATGTDLSFADRCSLYAEQHNVTFTEARARLRKLEA